ncbi:hypothetical protein MUO15_16460 [Halobacillus amylolyticus]|uniref:Uracil-DNA glycosylase n=1 Tax=Halobacillus amylolyticus TaxID=2932259 RepID=A0ABY4H9Q5_9BACI|nr:hypothetical protein MUO15_16460 [Halobacillus amylolyticus]
MRKVNCFKCKHFFTTWNPQFPRGCKAYGFKGKEMPSDLVLKTTGTSCMQFESKSSPSQKPYSSPHSHIDIRM